MKFLMPPKYPSDSIDVRAKVLDTVGIDRVFLYYFLGKTDSLNEVQFQGPTLMEFSSGDLLEGVYVHRLNDNGRSIVVKVQALSMDGDWSEPFVTEVSVDRSSRTEDPSIVIGDESTRPDMMLELVAILGFGAGIIVLGWIGVRAKKRR